MNSEYTNEEGMNINFETLKTDILAFSVLENVMKTGYMTDLLKTKKEY